MCLATVSNSFNHDEVERGGGGDRVSGGTRCEIKKESVCVYVIKSGWKAFWAKISVFVPGKLGGRRKEEKS